jgi:hypothetical protein
MSVALQVGNTGPVQEFNIQVDPGVSAASCRPGACVSCCRRCLTCALPSVLLHMSCACSS